MPTATQQKAATRQETNAHRFGGDSQTTDPQKAGTEKRGDEGVGRSPDEVRGDGSEDKGKSQGEPESK